MSQVLAIASCRVSSVEQLSNNSLKTQKEAVIRASERLGATIPVDGWWSGNQSSKRGQNLNRKDIQEMRAYCKKDPRVKFLIVSEPDRFMRSIEEAMYLEMAFKLMGVRVWYANDEDLNNDDLPAKLMKFMKYFVAEGSNNERISKSINGQVQALKEGRYPFQPKPGYKRGKVTAIHEIDTLRGPILRDALVKIASHQLTPTQALVELNQSRFMEGGRALYKMDKFRKIITDPYYAGVVEIDKQVKYRNENGLHEPLISKEQHEQLLDIMSRRLKNQAGPRKSGNPKYPLNNIVNCELCSDAKNGRLVGFDHSNGKNPSLRYEKYRCRACKRYILRSEIHNDIEQVFTDNPISSDGVTELTEALETVWKEKSYEREEQINSLSRRLDTLKNTIRNHTLAAINPKNEPIKDEIMDAIAQCKQDVKNTEERLEELRDSADEDKREFLEFAYEFVRNMGGSFLEISPENRLRCKQVMFPAGFVLNQNKKVYTPEVSVLIRLAGNRKDAEASQKSLMVRVQGL